MSARKRCYTPTQNPNASVLVRRTNVSKKNTPILNETVCASTVCPNVKSSLTLGNNKSQIAEIECDLAYNDYLQSLMKQQILRKKVSEMEKVLQQQIAYQEANVARKREDLKRIQEDTELLIKKEEIVEMIHMLEDNIKTLQRIYGLYDTEKQAESVRTALEDKSGTLILNNINPINNQEQYNKLIESLNKLTCASEKILKSGRDFQGIHKLAEQCRNLVQIIKKVQETQVLLSTMGTHAVHTVLQKLSDGFAEQYENMN